MNTILSFAHAAIQYHRGRQNGLAGLAGIGIALLIVFQWHRIVPVLDFLGVVNFFKEIGLVHEGEAGFSGFLILMFFVKLSLLFMALLLVLVILVGLMSLLFSNTIFSGILLFLVWIIMLPFLLIGLSIQSLFGNKKNTLTVPKLSPLDSLLKEHSEELDREQAIMQLNRIPTEGDDLFLLGVTANNELYLVLPKPINFESSNYRAGELYGVPYTVEKYCERKHKPKSMFDVVPKLFRIKLKNNDINEREVLFTDEIVAFYKTNSEDMLSKFRGYKNHPTYTRYVRDIQKEYFESKHVIINNLKNATDKRNHDIMLKRLEMFDAINEDIVRLMFEAERTESIEKKR